jgi:hypothetical protein
MKVFTKSVTVLSAFSLFAFSADILSANIFTSGVTYSYNNNAPNGARPQDILSEQSLAVDISAGKYFQLNDTVGLTLAVDAAMTRHDKYSRLDSFSFGVSSSLKKKIGLGYFAPVLRLSVAAAHLDSKHNPRDQWVYNAGFGISKRLHDRFDISLQYSYKDTQADDVPVIDNPFLVSRGITGDAYDLTTNRIDALGIFSATERLSLYAGYARQQGTIIASTPRYIEILDISDAVAPDPVFGEEIVAYTFDADSNIYMTGLSWAINGHTSINLGYERRESKGAAKDARAFTYDNSVFHTSILYGF